MNKSLRLFVPCLALAGCALFAQANPLPVFADGEETSEISSVGETVSSVSAIEEVSEEASEGKKGFGDIVIEGKTVEEWKKELSDSSTRNAVVMSLVMTALPAFLVVLKWLVEHKLNKGTREINDNAVAICKALEDKRRKFEEDIKVYETSFSEREAELRENLAAANLEAKKTQDLLNLIMTLDPSLIGADAYRKAKLELESKYGAGRSEE